MSVQRTGAQGPHRTDWSSLADPFVTPTGFRDYDARWLFPDEVNLAGVNAVGLAIGDLMLDRGIRPTIVAGHDFRRHSIPVSNALNLGLVEAGIEVLDIGMVLSPIAYFARLHLDVPSVAMVTASHNPAGWTGIKLGFEHPLTCGSEDMNELRDRVFKACPGRRPGGAYRSVSGIPEAYLSDLADSVRVSRRLKCVCATANGTASAFAPDLLSRLGMEVVPLHTQPDHRFPNYNPNPEALNMLRDMASAVEICAADLAFGFDGDGDRLGVVDNRGHTVSADKLGLLLARFLARSNASARFIADVKSTGLFWTDEVLGNLGCAVQFARTGHSHMKRMLRDSGALAGFEKSGHFYFSEPIGHGYDCALRAAALVCQLLDAHPDRSLSDLIDQLPSTWISPTMSPHCADDAKHEVMARLNQALRRFAHQGGQLAGRGVSEVIEVDGTRLMLEDGSWALVRASSNMPNLVVVCESARSERDLRRIFSAFDALLRQTASFGEYDQSID
ncbi:MAG: phosphomannomutase/phosphoglucomutase [Rhodobacteraceae bacterium]|nr:phosphomannomutase/phosphoglucomutase [Paracoccaceae bacterium]